MIIFMWITNLLAWNFICHVIIHLLIIDFVFAILAVSFDICCST